MNIKSIEPTPSPNTMKVILDEELSSGKRNNYTTKEIESAPIKIQQILMISGVKGVYHVADFLAVERISTYDWKEILQEVRKVFGEIVEENTASVQVQGYGEVNVYYQMYAQVPIQIKLVEGEQEHRLGLPSRFKEAV